HVPAASLVKTARASLDPEHTKPRVCPRWSGQARNGLLSAESPPRCPPTARREMELLPPHSESDDATKGTRDDGVTRLTRRSGILCSLRQNEENRRRGHPRRRARLLRPPPDTRMAARRSRAAVARGRGHARLR